VTRLGERTCDSEICFRFSGTKDFRCLVMWPSNYAGRKHALWNTKGTTVGPTDGGRWSSGMVVSLNISEAATEQMLWSIGASTNISSAIEPLYLSLATPTIETYGLRRRSCSLSAKSPSKVPPSVGSQGMRAITGSQYGFSSYNLSTDVYGTF